MVMLAPARGAGRSTGGRSGTRRWWYLQMRTRFDRSVGPLIGPGADVMRRCIGERGPCSRDRCLAAVAGTAAQRVAQLSHTVRRTPLPSGCQWI